MIQSVIQQINIPTSKPTVLCRLYCRSHREIADNTSDFRQTHLTLVIYSLLFPWIIKLCTGISIAQSLDFLCIEILYVYWLGSRGNMSFVRPKNSSNGFREMHFARETISLSWSSIHSIHSIPFFDMPELTIMWGQDIIYVGKMCESSRKSVKSTEKSVKFTKK